MCSARVPEAAVFFFPSLAIAANSWDNCFSLSIWLFVSVVAMMRAGGITVPWRSFGGDAPGPVSLPEAGYAGLSSSMS